MSEPHTKPETWAQASGGWTIEFFKMRVLQTKSIPHLKAALEYEKETRNRGDRLTTLSSQLDKAIQKKDAYHLREAIEAEAEKENPDREFIGHLNTELQERK